MRIFAAWLFTTALALVGCGGNVILDGEGSIGAAGGGAGGAGGAGTGGTSGLGGIGAGGDVFATGGAVGEGGATNCSLTCAQALTNGGVPCASDTIALTDYDTLRSCAGCNDVGNCEGVCVNLCQGAATDATCLSCIQTNCATELFACQTD